MERLTVKKRTKLLLLYANCAIIAAIVLIVAAYLDRRGRDETEEQKKSFTAAVASMQRVSGSFSMSQQRSCNDWANYINSHNMTHDEAARFIFEANASGRTMGHIVDYDTLKGISSHTDEYGSKAVDYSQDRDVFEDVIKHLRNGKLEINKPFITPMFANPINGIPALGFCQDVMLDERDGKHFLLVRTVPLDYFYEQLIFQTEYEDAEVSLVHIDGSCLARPSFGRNENFWEYLEKSNGADSKSVEDMKIRLANGERFLVEMKNHEGEDSWFVCVPSNSSSELFYVGYIKKSSLSETNADFAPTIIILIGVLILVTVDGLYIRYMNNKLKESVRQTEIASAAKTKFLSAMSHDIRTPMNAIVGMTAIAAKHVDDPKHVEECLGKITLASHHLLTLINDVLDISKVESGKMTLNPVVFSLSESVSNLINIVRPQVKEKALDFRVHVKKIEKEYLFADELRINQIFINLLTNAVKYTNPGGSVAADFEEIIDENDETTVILQYSVADTGIGMSEEFKKNMYDLFTRAVDTRIDKIQGSGLGLAITKQMVDLMNGEIDCESEPGKGTKFTVRLRVAVAEKITEEMVLPPLEILLCDDDEIFLETAGETLASMNVSADFATSGRQAIEMTVKRHEAGRDYPVVVIDWQMPGMDGVETTRNIRRAVGNDVPIIIISSYDWSDIEQDAIEAGANGFINKPLFRSTFYGKINELLGNNSHKNVSDTDKFEDLRGLRLLVAEDNELNREIIEELLGEYGVECACAENGEICVNMLKASKRGEYAAILMDVQMPIMNGYGATKAIRQLADEKKRNIPIIAMTADAFAEDIQACLDAGMDAHVSKPIEINNLFRKVRAALEKVNKGK